MQGASGLLNVLTLPPGALKSQARLVLDGLRGALFVYANGGALVGSWASTAGVDPYGNVYPAGLDVAVGSITGTVFTGVNFVLNQNGLFFYSTQTPAQVQSVGGTNGNYPGGNNITVGTLASTTKGNTAIFTVTYVNEQGITGITSAKMTQSGAALTRLARIPVSQAGSTVIAMLEVWANYNNPGGDTQVTWTYTDTWPFLSFAYYIKEFSGLGPTPSVDVNVSANAPNTLPTSFSSGSGTTTSAIELLLGCVGGTEATNNTAPTITGPGAPWNNPAQQGVRLDSVTGAVDLLAGYQITSAAGSNSYAGTFSAGQNYGAILLSLNPSGGTTLIGGWAVNAGQDSNGNVYPAGLFMIGGGQDIAAYSSSPPSGTNLVATLSGTARTDAFSNAIPAGISTILALLKGQASAPSANSGGAIFWASSAGALEVTRPSNITPTFVPAEVYSSGNPLISIGNTTTNSNASAILTIPANDAVTNSRYEIEIHGSGTLGATTIEGMTITLSINGTTFASVPVGTVLFSAVSQTFSFTCRATLHIIQGGSSGLSHGHLTGVMANTSVNHGGSTQATLDGAGSTNAAFNTTVSNTMVINWQWGGAGGAAQVCNIATCVVRRMGP